MDIWKAPKSALIIGNTITIFADRQYNTWKLGESKSIFVEIDHDNGKMQGRSTPRKIYLYENNISKD